MDKTYFMSNLCEADVENKGKTKVQYDEYSIDNNLVIYYCDLEDGCDAYSRKCSSGCPYVTKEYIKNGTKEHAIHTFIKDSQSLLDDDELLQKFINGDLNTFDEKIEEELIKSLAKTSAAKLEHVSFLQPQVVKKAIKLIERERESWLKDAQKTYPKCTRIADYLFIEIRDLPEIKLGGKNYWHSLTYFGGWVKVTDIDAFFLKQLRTPRSMWMSKEGAEEYKNRIEALLEYFEKEFEISTLLELAE